MFIVAASTLQMIKLTIQRFLKLRMAIFPNDFFCIRHRHQMVITSFAVTRQTLFIGGRSQRVIEVDHPPYWCAGLVMALAASLLKRFMSV